ncbi:MAG: hypothetical protein WKG00_30885 [Polyangiaceae bacterium]
MMLLAAGLAGCEEEAPVWDTLRVVVDTDAEVPAELDAFSLTVERSGVTVLSESWDASVLAALPDSFVIGNENPNNDSPDQQLSSVKPITVTVIGYHEGTPRLRRSAELRFNRGNYQLPLPLCADCLDVDCPAEQTCKRGACAGDDIGAVSELPDDEDGTLTDALGECSP